MKKYLTLIALLIFVQMPRSQAAVCNADIVDYNGYVVQSFTNYDYDYNYACYKSQNQCSLQLERFRRARRFLFARCVTRGHNPVPPNRIVTRRCRFNLMRRNFVINSFFATSTGIIRTGVQKRACDMALNQCLSRRIYDEYCQRDFRY